VIQVVRRAPVRFGPVVALVSVVVLVAVPAAGSPRPGAAGAITEPGLVSEQLVTSTLDASGLPVTSTLTTQVVARDQERGDVLVPTSTKDLRYLDRRGAPPTEGDAAVVALGGPGTSAALLGSSFARPLPVALHAEYRRDGATVDPAALEGAGDLTIVYTATNTVVTEQTIAYADAAGERRSSVQRVFAPFAGTLAVALPAGASVRSAPGAVVGTGADGGTFVAWDLVLYPPIGAPQRQMVLELSSPALAVPGARMQVLPVTAAQDPAVAFSTDLLGSTVEGNATLAEGLTELDANARRVAEGSLQVTEGLAQVASGADALAESVSTELVPGAESLVVGAQQQAAGQSELAEALGTTSTGAEDLSSGATELSAGLEEIAAGLAALAAPSGLPAAEAAARDLEAAVGEIADAVGSSPDPPITLPPSGTPTLVQLSRASGAAAAALRTTTLGVSSALGAIATQLVTVQGDATSAATSVSGVYAAACQPAPSALSVAQCAALQDAVTDATAAATGAGAAAAAVGTQAATLTATAQGLAGLAGALTALTDGLLEVSAALRSGDAAAPGVAEGLAALADGLTSSVTAVTRLAVGATDSSAGAEALATGTEQLATGLEDTSTGAEQLAAGGEQIAEGAEGLATGVDGVAEGSAELASGASTAEEGSASVTDGATSLAEEGTSVTLDSVVEASADPALARAYLEAASDAAGTSAPYAAPEGGVARVAYVSEIPAVPAPAGALDPVVLGMALLVGATAVAVVVLARRRIRRVAAAE
jgi:putative membrane protein